MAALVRAHDWSQTPLGPIEQWPQALRLAVGICLNSRFPMFVWWGPQLINIYNDAYIPVLGKRHPHALGRAAQQIWHEIWPVVGPQADAVMCRGEATWNERVRLVMERHGYTEETYFTWSYSPIPDDAGAIGGLFCACTEETQRVRAEERVHGILESIADGFVSLDRDWRFVYVNTEAERLLGTRRADLLGRTQWEVFPATAGGLYERECRRAMHDRVTVEFEHCYEPWQRWFAVKAFPTGASGISVYFQDVTERKRTESELREKERRLRQAHDLLEGIAEGTQDLIAAMGKDFRYTAVNQSYRRDFRRVFGRDVSVGTDMRDALAHLPDDRRHAVELWSRALRGEVVSVTAEFGDRALGERRTFDLRFFPLRDADGQVIGAGEIATDITDRRRAEDRANNILESITDAFLALDGEWRFTYLNAQAQRVLDRRDLIGKVIWDEYPGLIGSEFEQVYRGAARERVALSLTAYYPDHDRWYEVHAYPAAAAAGDGISVYFRNVTERKRDEAALRESEERFRAAFDQSVVGIVLADLDGRILRANDAFCELVGRPRAEVEGVTSQGFTHGDDVGRNVDIIGRLRARQALSSIYEKRYVRPDGTVVHAQINLAAVRDAADNAVGIIAVVQDVTEQKRAEEQLRRNHDTFYHLIQNNPFGIYVVDADFRLRQVSLGSQKVFATIQPLLGRDFAEVLREIWAEPFASEAIARFRHTLETGEAFASPTTVERRQDIPAVEAYDWRIERLTLPDGRFGVVCYFYDLSERQRWEAALREGEERLRLALAIAQMGTFEIDLRSDAVTVNDAGRAIYGWPDGEPLTFAKVQAHFHPADRDYVMRAVAEALRPDSPGVFEVEQRIIRRDGATRWIRVRGRAVFDALPAAAAAALPASPAERAAVRCIGTYIDITEQKEVEREREQLLLAERAARAEAERASEAKSEFLATLSHELRTPLTPVLLTVSLMESNPALPPELRDDVATIRRNVELESRLISDLLDLTRITKGKLQLDTQDVDLHLILRSAIDICQREASARMVVDLRATRHLVRGDSTRLQQIFWNLINNAQKFTGPEGTVTVRSSDAGGDGRVRVEVIDTGAGIDPAVLPRLFNAFEQGEVRAQQRQAGLGLGLAISKKLTEAHGGTIAASSAGRGRGATFTVDLPAVVKFVPEHKPAPGARSLATVVEPLNVLIVEDHEPTLRVMVRLLKRLGHSVTGVMTVAAATAAARQDGFDLIISDLGLPDGSGLDVMRQLREQYAGRAIALTGYGMDSDIAASREAGFAEHLTKPVDVQALESAIRRLKPGAATS